MWSRTLQCRSLAFSAAISNRRPTWHKLRCSSGKGFGKQVAPPNNEKKEKKKGRAAEETEKGRVMEPNELLKAFKHVEDKERFAEENAEGLTEKFFVVADALLKMAQSKGDKATAASVESTIQAAMKVKNQHLRPEIALMNSLLMATTTKEQRTEIISTKESKKVLQMNDGYFFTLVDRVHEDASRWPDSKDKSDVLQQLQDIKQECLDRLAKA